MIFRAKPLIHWFNWMLIFCLVGHTLTPLLVLADIPLATTKQVEASSPLTTPETPPQPPQPQIDFQQNPPFTPVKGLGVYLGLNDAIRVEVVEGSIISGSPSTVDTYGDGNEEWVTAQASGTAMWIDVEYDFNLPAGSQYVVEGYRDYDRPFEGYYWNGLAWIRMGNYGGVIPVSTRWFRFGSAHYYSPGIANGYPFHWDAFRIGGPGTRFPDDQGYGNECPICSNGQRHYVGGPIDVFSGNYAYSQIDITLNTLVTGQPLEFRRSYNSQTITDTSTGLYTLPLSSGWTHNYAMDLVFSQGEGGEENTLILKSMGGSRLRFEAKGNGTFEAYPGINAKLSQIGTGYQITTTNQTVYYFDLAEVGASKPQLLAIRDPKGNETTLSYSNGRLSRVSGAMGRYFDLGYDSSQRLSSITDHSGRKIRYGFDSLSRLSVMTDTRGLVWEYSYSGTTNLLQTVTNPAGQVVEQTLYNEEGQAIAQENGLGQRIIEIAYPHSQVRVITQSSSVVTDTFDGRGLLISQVDVAGNEVLYQLDGNFERTATQDGNSNVTAFVKNEVGLTTIVTDSLGYSSVLTYNNRYNLTAFEDARGYVSYYSYDQNNNLTQVVNPLGGTAVFTYNARGQVTATKNENGYITALGYDSFGNTIAITNALQNVNRFEYDNLSRLTHSIDPLGHITFNEYDPADNLIRVTVNYTPAHSQNHLNQYNLITEYAYNRANQPTLITDTVGRVTKYTYNQAGQLIETIENYVPNQPQNYQNEYNLTTSYSFDDFARPVIVTDTIGRQTRTIYNVLNQVEQSLVNYVDGVYDPAFPDVDLITTYYYDSNANLVSTVDVLGRETRIIYDGLNRVDKVILNYQEGLFDPAFPDTDLITTYHYDPVSNLSQLINPNGQVTAYQFDPLNRLETVIENYVSGTYRGIPDRDVITKYQYDAVNNRTGIIDANGHLTTYAFDPLNRLVSQTDALSQTTSQQYNALGNPTQTIKPNGTVITTTYNAANRVTAIDYSDTTPDVTFAYNAVGKVLTMTDGLTYSTSYQYNSLDQVTQIKDGFNQTLTYQFDVLGRQTHLVYPDNRTLTYTYDLVNRPQTLTDWIGGQYGYGYNGASELTTLTYPNGVRANYNYDGAGRLTQLAYRHQNQVLAQYDYTLDTLGNRIQAVEHLVKPTIPTSDTTSITDTYMIYLPLVLKGGLPPAQIIDYNYDNLNRLISATYTTGETYFYSYDPTGNRLQQIANNEITTYQYNEANRLTQVNNVTYTWDDNGNLLNDGIRTFSYDAENRLTQVMSSSLSTQFEYNGFGDRTRKWVNGVETQYLLDPLGLTQVLAETTDGQRQFYVAGLAQYDGTEWAYQLPDPLGSVRQLVDAQGQVKLTQNYDPFGNLLAQVGAVQSGFGYTGQQHHPGAGLVYLRARYYDPMTGRFITPDSLIPDPTSSQMSNRYAYATNNPIRYTDPSGHCIFGIDTGFCIAAAAGILLGGAIYANLDTPTRNYLVAQEFKLAFFHYLPDKLIEHYACGQGERLELTLQEMIDSKPAVDITGKYLQLSKNNIRQFDTEVQSLVALGGGTKYLKISTLTGAGKEGTLGRFTIHYEGILKVTVDTAGNPSWVFEGEMYFYDEWNFNPENRGIIAEGAVTIGRTLLQGEEFKITSVRTPVRQTSSDQLATWAGSDKWILFISVE